MAPGRRLRRGWDGAGWEAARVLGPRGVKTSERRGLYWAVEGVWASTRRWTVPSPVRHGPGPASTVRASDRKLTHVFCFFIGLFTFKLKKNTN